jgi:hypothetical protein
MSRGHGALQRFLLDDLRCRKPGNTPDAWQLATRYYGSPVNANQESSVRRALRGLEAEGLVERRVGRGFHGQPSYWRAT